MIIENYSSENIVQRL